MMVGDSLDDQTIVKQTLNHVDVVGVPALPFPLVVAVDQLVVEIEDAGVTERFIEIPDGTAVRTRERSTILVVVCLPIEVIGRFGIAEIADAVDVPGIFRGAKTIAGG